MWVLGYDLNLVWSVLIFFTIFMIFYSGVISLLEDHLPTVVLELFHYGKTLNGPVKSSLVSIISVPKSYFTHFYIFSSVYIPTLLYLSLSHYTTNIPVSPSVISGLDLVCSSSRSVNTNPISITLVLILMTLQIFRRLYECVFINQRSSSTMNITHYIVGFAHYFCAGSGYVCEAPGFVSGSSFSSTLTMSSLPISSLIFSLLFIIAWCYQLETHKIFAQLKISNPNKHSMPEGSLFNYVSCPHYMCEIIIYTCLMLILGPAHRTGVMVWAWVTINQVIAATMSHRWYLTKFDDYPKNRKAIIPFIW
eukprot:TRINITY_DN17721_c0_g1_i3.p1 TRINITY_DN17721_c0_g1~~TRINITY_DN17721_c0_g1_i3.p1  ORF type:complete len:307 (-),score=74.95 TRINITY_DN17721_c0_g1_i3:117-1037(-)